MNETTLEYCQDEAAELPPKPLVTRLTFTSAELPTCGFEAESPERQAESIAVLTRKFRQRVNWLTSPRWAACD